MRKAEMYKKINRNTIFDTKCLLRKTLTSAHDEHDVHESVQRSHRISPQHILTSDPWMPDGELGRPSGMQIVELRSSASDQSAKEDNEQRRPNSNDDHYNINEDARERRRKCNENQGIPNSFQDDMSHMTQFQKELVYANYLYSDASDMDNANAIYKELNCFTIYDNHLTNSDNSNEDGGVELTQCGTPSQDWSYDISSDWNHAQDTEFVTFDPDSDKEKRTVWIYSFKNKRLLSQNDYELVNIPSTSSSMEIEDLDEGKSICRKPNRIPTPHPPSNIQKLKIPTLSAVTEYTEPKVSLSSRMEVITDKEKFRLKENNNWFSAQVTPKNEDDTNDKNSTSVLNWMALSPRDRRRRFRHVTSPIPFPHDINILPTVKEATSTAEKIEELPMQVKTIGCGDGEKEVDATDKEHDDTLIKVACDQGTNTDISFTSRKSVREMCSAVAVSARKSAKSLRNNVSSAIGSLATVREQRNVKSPRETSKIKKQNLDSTDSPAVFEARVSAREKDNTSKNASPDAGRGDFSNRKVPRISIPTTAAVKLPTEPVENLKSSNWIQEESLIGDDRIRTPTDGKGDRASDAIWIRNMALLKPAEWTAYLPIAESIPSLHLSMNTDSIDGSQTWFRRMVNFFRCCK